MNPVLLSLYDFVQSLPRYGFADVRSALPPNAIYLMFEEGEQQPLPDGRVVDRIVRVGSHRVNGRFPDRMRQHYGNKRGLGGHKNTSVLRRHVGGALLNRADSADPRIPQWAKQGGDSAFDVEEEVSRYLRDAFTFTFVRLDDADTRTSLEARLIALVAQGGAAAPSDTWLGRRALSPEIPWSGLWNTQHLRGVPLLSDGFQLLRGGQTRLVSHPTESLSGGTESRHEMPPARAQRPRPTGVKHLVIIPCGKKKIWDAEPDAGPTPAADAYRGVYFGCNREYAETFGTSWLVLSAKYGFLFPGMLVPADYNLTFKHRKPGLVSVDELCDEVGRLRLDLFDEVIALGGAEYRDRIGQAFADTGVAVLAPFEGLRQGEQMSATRWAVQHGDPMAKGWFAPAQ